MKSILFLVSMLVSSVCYGGGWKAYQMAQAKSQPAPVAETIPAPTNKYVVSWHADGEPADALAIDTNEVPVTASFTLKDGIAEGEARVQLADFKTGDTKRDGHMKEAKYLDTAKHPEAVLKLTPVKVTQAQFKWQGNLTMKGKTKSVWGMASVDGAGVLWARFTVDLKQWRDVIEKPRFLGMGISDEVIVTVKSK